MGFYYIVQGSHTPLIFLPQTPKYWNYSHKLPQLAKGYFLTTPQHTWALAILVENPSLVPNTHVKQLTTSCKSSTRVSVMVSSVQLNISWSHLGTLIKELPPSECLEARQWGIFWLKIDVESPPPPIVQCHPGQVVLADVCKQASKSSSKQHSSLVPALSSLNGGLWSRHLSQIIPPSYFVVVVCRAVCHSNRKQIRTACDTGKRVLRYSETNT